MLQSKYAAIDFGAESGRIILGSISNTKIGLEEIHRFANHQIKVFDNIHWDLLHLFRELKKGLACVSAAGHKKLMGIGVDTWGVDFGLIGRNKTLLGNPYCYRDSRTNDMMELALKKISQKNIYESTGIQFMQLNSLFQLLSMVETNHPLLDVAETLLFMPDLFNFLLTGEVYSDYTIASTSQLLDARTKEWAPGIFKHLRLPLQIMPQIIQPKTLLGELKSDICRETALDSADVIVIGSHDTASAVAAVPAKGKNWAYLSSGTWSLLGVEVKNPIINEKSLHNNFTNEGGVEGTIRFLRNIMGMWLFERCRLAWRENNVPLSYESLITMTSQAQPFKCIIDPDDALLLNPPDMPQAMVEFCKRSGQPPPANKGEFVRCIFESLALKYRFIITIL